MKNWASKYTILGVQERLWSKHSGSIKTEYFHPQGQWSSFHHIINLIISTTGCDLRF